jgi:type IV pilus assembly protein PilC
MSTPDESSAKGPLKRFLYTALDGRGFTISGELEAGDVSEALNTLKKEKLKLLHIETINIGVVPRTVSYVQKRREKLSSLIKKYWNMLANLNVPWNRVNERNIFLFTHQLATILKAGVTISSGMRIISEAETDRKFVPVLRGLVESMERGYSVYQSFRRYPRVFNRAYAGIIGVGEASGRLPDILATQAKDLEKLYTFKRKVIASLTYPVTILAFSIISVTVMMVYFVPNFTGIYKETATKLPIITTMLIASVNSLMSPYFWVGLVAVALSLCYLMSSFLRTPVGRYTFDSFTLRMPVVGELVSRNILYSILMYLACMLECGIHISESMEILKSMMHNMVFANVLDKMIDDLREGSTLSDSVRDIWFIPRFTKDFIQAGEMSGEMPHMLRKAAELIEAEVNAKLETFLNLLEPVLIAMLALFVGGIMIAIFLPISNLINSFSM